MTIKILAFGIAKEILGDASIQRSFEQELNVVGIKDWLETQYPRFKSLSSFAIAINGEYAKPDSIIKSGDEVAIIPPVSGG